MNAAEALTDAISCAIMQLVHMHVAAEVDIVSIKMACLALV